MQMMPDISNDLAKTWHAEAQERRRRMSITTIRQPHKRDSLSHYPSPIGPPRWVFVPTNAPASMPPPIPMGTARRILKEVADEGGVPVSELIGPWRTQHIVHLRQKAMYRLRHETLMSLPQIGRFMGGRDHTTVLHGIAAHQGRLTGVEPERIRKNRERMYEYYLTKLKKSARAPRRQAAGAAE
jgi:hypothetical protein